MTKAIIVSKVDLSPVQRGMLEQPTPAVYIRMKPGRGGRQVRYIEGGFVINRLNQVLGPLNWSFKVTERGETTRKNEQSAEGEVWVYGEMTIHDHKSGASVIKGQFGQHPIHKNVPIGDAYKAAETDSLKKVAAMLGIGLDVMWSGMDSGRQESPAPVVAPVVSKVETKGAKAKPDDVFSMAKEAIQNTNDPQTLANLIQRVDAYEDFTVAQKHQLKTLIHGKLKK